MNIALCYVAVTRGKLTADFAAHFVATYQQFPPGAEHDAFILCNGGPLSHETALIFSRLNPKFYPRVNDGGYDISAYLDAARGPCRNYDMMLCLGESCYFHRPGWLSRMIEVWEQLGPGMYGSFSSNLIHPHLNTTGFVCAPEYLATYPHPVSCRKERYAFEHGTRPFWKWVVSRGGRVCMVTWDGEWSPKQWRLPQNILWRGNQTNCLMFCQHTDRYSEAPERTRRFWEMAANSSAS